MARKRILREGSLAPDFRLPSTIGGKTSLREFRKKYNTVLYFYPKDNTPGCTRQAAQFRDAHDEMDKTDAVVIGVSMDSLHSHEKFHKKLSLNFRLLSDEDAHICKLFGVYKKKKLFGREFWGIERSTFIIDKNGKIRKIWRTVSVDGHTEEVLEFLHQMHNLDSGDR